MESPKFFQRLVRKTPQFFGGVALGVFLLLGAGVASATILAPLNPTIVPLNTNGNPLVEQGPNDVLTSSMFNAAVNGVADLDNRTRYIYTNDKGLVGIGTRYPGATLDVAGIVRAIAYIGDGSYLYGVARTTDIAGFIKSTDVNALGKASLACATGEIAKYNGSAWACAADATGSATSLPWGSVTGIPTGFADGVDDTLTESQVDAFVANNGYLKSFSEADPTVNGLGKATLACATGEVAKYNGSTWVCAADATGSATSLPWGSVTGIPAGFADGVDDTLTEGQVDAFVANNGYLMNSSVNTLAKSTLACATGEIAKYNGSAWACAADATGSATSLPWGSVTGIPAGFADGVDDTLTESQVDAFVANNGYLKSFSEADPTVNGLGKASLACTTGQVAKYNGTTWACAADATGTTLMGTQNFLTKYTTATSVGNSVVYDNGTNVGIGTTAPAVKLDVNGDASIGGRVLSVGGSADSVLMMRDNQSEGLSKGKYVYAGGNTIGFLGGSYGWLLSVGGNGDTNINGRVLTMGITDSVLMMRDIQAVGKAKYLYGGGDNIGFLGGDYGWLFRVDSTGNGWIKGALTQASDVRLKKDIVTLPNALEKILNLRGVSYSWRDETRSTAKQVGLIAQEVEKEYPELVSTDKEGIKGVNYSGLVAPLIEAVKTLNTKNEELEKKLQQQDERIAELEKLVLKK